jgi:hypothetical protein
MTVIQLLNKIANGEDVPKKIKYEDNIYIHVDNYCYFCEETNEILSQNIYAEFSRLNDEIEIIEEDKKIEKLDYAHPDIECSYNESQLLLRIKENKKKINEIIDHINKGDK